MGSKNDDLSFVLLSAVTLGAAFADSDTFSFAGFGTVFDDIQQLHARRHETHAAPQTINGADRCATVLKR